VVGLHEVEIQTEWWFSERGVDIWISITSEMWSVSDQHMGVTSPSISGPGLIRTWWTDIVCSIVSRPCIPRDGRSGLTYHC
jgi:hypothetical protein